MSLFCFLLCFFCLFVCLFFILWLCWVFVSVQGLSLVGASGGHSSSRCAGLSLSRPFLLRSTGSRRAGSVIVAQGPSCSAAREIFPDQGSNPCPLHWQADSQPLHHQGSPAGFFLFFCFLFINVFIYLFLAALGLRCCGGLSLVAASGGYSSLQCAGFSLWWLLLLQSMGCRRAGFSSCGTRPQ